ncbi:MAG: hypothetical protein A2Y95_04735 [Deltaproteobacteria bacterium RBG_13_65_10]|nr:MAG: hypothetical protein A2Y95_04735 [Deltaproteobacteria bacterium RBG_13_65_10]
MRECRSEGFQALAFGTVAFLGAIAVWSEITLCSFHLTSVAKLLQTITLAWAVKCWADESVGAAQDYARLLAAGLAFSIAGDFFLMGILDRESRAVLATGILSFTFTQMFYARALHRVGNRPSAAQFALFMIAFPLLAIANHWTLQVPLNLAFGSAAYTIFLGVSVAYATAGLRNENLPFGCRRAAALGAWLFALTDGFLPVVLYGPQAGIQIPHLGLWVYQAYVISQCFYALSAFWLESTEA